MSFRPGYIFVFIMITLNAGLVEAQIRAVSIDECVRLSIENSDEVKISVSKIKESKEKAIEVSSQTLPQLRLSGNYSRLSSVDPFEVVVPFSPEPFKIAETYFNSYNFRLSATQLVFSGFRVAALENISEYGTEIANVDYDEARNNISFEAQIAYWNLIKAMFSRRIAEETVVQTDRSVNDTKNFLAAGLATTSDLLRLQVLNSNAKIQLLEAENAIRVARVALNRIIGFDLETQTIPDTSSIPGRTALQEVNYYVTNALQNRNEIRNLNYAILSSEENIRAARSAYFPYISLFGNVYYANPNLRIQPPVDEFRATWDVGIGFTWDIWNWGQTAAVTEQASQVKLQNKSKLSLAKKKIEQEVRQKFSNTEYEIDRIDAAKTSVDLAQQSYDEVLKKYEVQLSSSTELSDAETSLFIARTNYAFALVDYRISYLALLKASGMRLY